MASRTKISKVAKNNSSKMVSAEVAKMAKISLQIVTLAQDKGLKCINQRTAVSHKRV